MPKDDDSDLILRHLCRLLPDHFARALAPPATSLRVLGWLDTEVTSRKRRLDQVLHVEIDGVPRLQHVEWQTAWADSLPWRIFEYQTLLALAETGPATKAKALQPPVESTVVLLSGREEPWPPWMSFRLSPPEAPFSGVQFRLEAVYQRSVQELCERGSLLWLLFAPLARDASEQKMSQVVERLRQQAPDEATFREVGAAMTALAEADHRERHLGPALLSLLSREVVMQSSIFQMGKAEGKAEGMKEAVLAVLGARGLEVSEAQRQRILSEADLTAVARWLTEALTVEQTEALWQPTTARKSKRAKSRA